MLPRGFAKPNRSVAAARSHDHGKCQLEKLGEGQEEGASANLASDQGGQEGAI